MLGGGGQGSPAVRRPLPPSLQACHTITLPRYLLGQGDGLQVSCLLRVTHCLSRRRPFFLAQRV